MSRRAVSAIAALALPLFSIDALAHSVSIGVSLRATVPKYCRAGSGLATFDVAVAIQVNAEGALVPVTPVALPRVVCNAAALITLRSLGGGARAANEADIHVRYLATTQFGTATVALDTASVASTGPTSGALAGRVSVVIAPVQPAAELVPGTMFTDTLRISLAPR